jgi:acyl-CoA hydrolase
VNEHPETVTHELVKSADLNHHQTLFAGRAAEWLVAAGFVTAAAVLGSTSTVCVSVDAVRFRAPVRAGQILVMRGRPALAGRTSLTVYVYAELLGASAAAALAEAAPGGSSSAETEPTPAPARPLLEGFIRFVKVDEAGRAVAHGLTLTPSSAREHELAERARALPRV